jgi:hypothetical protein
MKKNRALISTIFLVVTASVSCAQNPEKKSANHSVEAVPELRWKYEAGG